jgi:glycosyltransferase involved in cell wall biosynthesis
VSEQAAIRVLVLGDARQVHVHRWSEFLSHNGYETLTVSLEPLDGVRGDRRRISLPAFLPDFARYPLATSEVRRIVKRFEPDVVNAHFLPNYGMIAALGGFSPWVLSTWGSDVMLLPEKSPFHLWRTRFVIGRADWITSDAEVMSRRLVELGASPTRVLTFPYGVDRTRFFPASVAVSPHGPRIVCNRKMERVYNVSALVEAFPELLASASGASLTLAGDGSLRSSLEEIVGRSAPKEAVRFVGDVDHTEMPDLLRRHDVFVSVALSDTTSVSLLEAMACGLFPVVSDIPANREWIEQGRNGFLVDPHDTHALARAIAEAWERPDLRDAAAKRNAGLIEARADWYRNMSIVDGLFRRLARR